MAEGFGKKYLGQKAGFGLRDAMIGC